MVLLRTLGTFKDGDIKMSYMEGEALAKKKDPGPQHKYTINYDL